VHFHKRRERDSIWFFDKDGLLGDVAWGVVEDSVDVIDVLLEIRDHFAMTALLARVGHADTFRVYLKLAEFGVLKDVGLVEICVYVKEWE
jgi:hypothetical protein